MNPYPNYYPQMNNCGQQYNPQQQYMDRLAGLQQYQQNLQMQQPQMVGTQMSLPNQQMQMGINGKIVPAVENITANDVPMDGSVAFFPRQDMSEIYAKSWNADGTIKTVIYKPFAGDTNILPQADEKSILRISESVTGAFMQRFDELVSKIDELERSMDKPMTKTTTTSRNKKEAGTE